MVKLLYYREQTRHPNHPSWISKYLNLYGIYPMIIDRLGDWVGANPWIYASLDSALSDPANAGFDWVWMDAKGGVLLDKFEHPEDNVIYCVGSDYIGFDGKDVMTLPGTKVKLHTLPDYDAEWFASLLVPLICYDRFLFLEGKRK